jgi:hypothetical protein
MDQQCEQFRAQGFQVRFTVEGQPHRLETLAGDGAAWLFDQFEESRRGCHPAK